MFDSSLKHQPEVSDASFLLKQPDLSGKIACLSLFAPLSVVRYMLIQSERDVNMRSRILKQPSIRNGRDLGGLVNQDGLVIKRGLLFRSANLSAAEPEDLKQLSLSKIVDLRTSREVKEAADVVSEGTDYVHIPIFDEAKRGISHEKEAEFDITAVDFAETYRELVLGEISSRNFGRAVKQIMSCEGPVLWHCTEGKDRCGLTTAFLLEILGVSRDVIYEDYLITNLVNEPRAEMFYSLYLHSGYSRAAAENVRNVFLAKREYLDIAYESIEKKYGWIQNYLDKALGLTEEETKLFKTRVLE